MTQNNIKIAITGGIGSGKSAVASIVEEAGYTVLSCDKIYSKLLQNNEFLSALENEFCGIIKPDGSLDRRKLSGIVFNDGKQLEKLNALTHPAIMGEVFSRLKNERLGFCEVPLLFEGGYEKLFDGVIVVLRDEASRIGSVTKRDGLNEMSVKKRLKSQFDYQNCDLTKYYVIHNDGNFDDLRAKVSRAIDEIEKKYF